MGFFDVFKPKNQRFDIERYSLNDSDDKIIQDLMADPEGSNMFFRTYELLGYDPTDINVQNDQALRQKVIQVFIEIVRLAIASKLSPPGANVVLIGELDFKITLESRCNKITELYRSYVKQLFKISR